MDHPRARRITRRGLVAADGHQVTSIVSRRRIRVPRRLPRRPTNQSPCAINRVTDGSRPPGRCPSDRVADDRCLPPDRMTTAIGCPVLPPAPERNECIRGCCGVSGGVRHRPTAAQLAVRTGAAMLMAAGARFLSRQPQVRPPRSVSLSERQICEQQEDLPMPIAILVAAAMVRYPQKIK